MIRCRSMHCCQSTARCFADFGTAIGPTAKISNSSQKATARTVHLLPLIFQHLLVLRFTPPDLRTSTFNTCLKLPTGYRKKKKKPVLLLPRGPYYPQYQTTGRRSHYSPHVDVLRRTTVPHNLSRANLKADEC